MKYQGNLPALAAIASVALAIAPAVAAPYRPVPNDLHVFAYIHDEIPDDDNSLMQRHFSDWLEEMQRVLPERQVHVHLRRGLPGITDAWYGRESAVTQWRQRLRDAPPPGEEPRVGAPGRLNLLLVGGLEVAPGAPGMTLSQGAPYAFASVRSSAFVPAHELGHMMNARHEFASREEIGFARVCATFMWKTTYADTCPRYSIRNVEQIRAYTKWWDVQP